MIVELRRRVPDFEIDMVVDGPQVRVAARFTMRDLAIEVARVVDHNESVTEWKDHILRQCLSDLTASRAHSRMRPIPHADLPFA